MSILNASLREPIYTYGLILEVLRLLFYLKNRCIGFDIGFGVVVVGSLKYIILVFWLPAMHSWLAFACRHPYSHDCMAAWLGQLWLARPTPSSDWPTDCNLVPLLEAPFLCLLPSGVFRLHRRFLHTSSRGLWPQRPTPPLGRPASI